MTDSDAREVPDVHGIVCKGLKDFVVETHGEAAWNAIHEEAGLRKRIYVPLQEYPDEVVLELVEAASRSTDTDVDALLYEFGRFVVPSLVSTYGVHVDREWTGLDLIANVETYIHEALRGYRLSTFTPPRIASRRVDDDRVVVAYESDRGLCALADGLLVGVGEYYGEHLTVEEHRCVHEGAPRCEFLVTRGSASLLDELATEGTIATDHRDRSERRSPSDPPRQERARDEPRRSITR